MTAGGFRYSDLEWKSEGDPAGSEAAAAATHDCNAGRANGAVFFVPEGGG